MQGGIRQYDNWLCYNIIGADKKPINPITGEFAQANNPDTWSDFETAKVAMHEYDGLAFVIPYGICVIDLDKVIGNLAREARANKIIDTVMSYTELSPSGSGYHIICKVDMAQLLDKEEHKRLYYTNLDGIELYIGGIHNKFMTFTRGY